MFRRIVSRPLLAGLLMAALLMQSLLPAFAGLRSGEHARWIEVCVSSGIKWVQVDANAADPAVDTGAGHQGQCVLCAATGAAPEFDVTRYLSSQAAVAMLLPVADILVTAFPGHALRSRAPPHHA